MFDPSDMIDREMPFDGEQDRSAIDVGEFDAAVETLRLLPKSVWLAALREDQTCRWVAGCGVSVRDYLERLPELRSEPEELLVLICGELLLRLEHGEPPDLGSYQREFPEFSTELARQFDINATLGHLETAGARNGASTSAEQIADMAAGGSSGRSASIEAGEVGDSASDCTMADQAPPGYGFLRVIGRGASSVVYLAQQESVGREVAVKVMSRCHIDDIRFARQSREIQILGLIQHPNVVQIYEAIHFRSSLYIVMEYVSGTTLADWVVKEPWAPRVAAQIVRQLADAVESLHQLGVSHRDLKPSNILYRPGEVLKISDFGLAKRTSDGITLTVDGLVGTPSYMAPELVEPGRAVGVSCDIYSLGAILYELLTGQPPHRGASVMDTLHRVLHEDLRPPRRVRSSVPIDLENICLKCLARKPEDRYRAAGDLGRDLVRYLSGHPVEARQMNLLQSCAKWTRRNPVVSVLIVLLHASMLSGLIGVSSYWRAAERARQVADWERNRSDGLREEAERVREQAQLRANELQELQTKQRFAYEALERARRANHFQYWDEAYQSYSQAIDEASFLVDALEERGHLLLSLHLYEAAFADLTAAWRQKPPLEFPDLHRLGCLSAWQGDWSFFERHVVPRSRVYVLDPPDLLRLETLVASPGAGYHQSLSRSEKVVGTAFQEGWYEFSLAKGYLRAGRYGDALDRCRRVLASDWTVRDIARYVEALAHHHLNDSVQAQQAYREGEAAHQSWIKRLLRPIDENWATHHNANPFWPISQIDWLEFQLLRREAGLTLRETVTESPWSFVLRGRGLASLRRSGEALREYDSALQLAPHEPVIQLEAARIRGNQAALIQDYTRASQSYSTCLTLAPDDSRLWSFLAIAQLADHNHAAYRQTCDAMLARFEDSTSIDDLHRVCDTCVWRADAVSDWTGLEIVARRYQPMDPPRSLRSAAEVLFRCGRDEEVVRILSSVEPALLRGSDCCILALVNHRLGRSDDADRWLKRAQDWIRRADETRPASEIRWGIWIERPATLVLEQEVEHELDGHGAASRR